MVAILFPTAGGAGQAQLDVEEDARIFRGIEHVNAHEPTPRSTRCPDLDKRRRQDPDSVDKCPRQAETSTASRTTDGCPDATLDTDGDKDPGRQGQVPKQPEDFNGFQGR